MLIACYHFELIIVFEKKKTYMPWVMWILTIKFVPPSTNLLFMAKTIYFLFFTGLNAHTHDCGGKNEKPHKEKGGAWVNNEFDSCESLLKFQDRNLRLKSSFRFVLQYKDVIKFFLSYQVKSLPKGLCSKLQALSSGPLWSMFHSKCALLFFWAKLLFNFMKEKGYMVCHKWHDKSSFIWLYQMHECCAIKDADTFIFIKVDLSAVVWCASSNASILY